MTDTALSQADRDAVETFVTEWLSDHRIPGAAVAITDADDTQFAEGFGARTLDSNTPVTERTLFGIGSCTKSFTAAAVMQLVADGRLDVDDPVDEFLPHLADAPGEPVTVHELLTHTSGMPSDGSAGPLITRPLGAGHVEVPLSSRADFRRHVTGSVDRRVTDRETFFYYNSGYTMLGLVVEAVTDRPFASYVEEEILEPVGMSRSTFTREAFEADDDRMTPYLKRDEETTPSDFPFDELIHAPGGLVSSVTEMARYIRLYLNGGTADGTEVLPAARVDAMTTPEAAYGTYLDGTEIGYGYGLMTEPFLDDRLVAHGGSIAVSNAWFGYLEEAGLGVTVACTTSPEAHPMTVGPAILALLRDEEPSDVVPYFELVETLEAVTGSYESYRDIVGASVERNGGTLTMSVESGVGGQELSLMPDRIEDDLLVCSTVTATGMEHPVRFELDGNGVECYFERNRFTKE